MNNPLLFPKDNELRNPRLSSVCFDLFVLQRFPASYVLEKYKQKKKKIRHVFQEVPTQLLTDD